MTNPKDKSVGERRFRLVVEAAPNAMVMIDRGGKIVIVNTQAERVFGYSRAELVGQPVEMLVPERFHTHHPGLRETFFADPQPRPMGMGRDLYGRKKDGREFPVEIGLNPIETDEGTMVLAAIIDITKRKRNEEAAQLLAQIKSEKEALQVLNAELEARVEQRTAALRTSEARLRTIFETSYQYQGLITLEGILLDANAISLQIINAKLEDVVGKPFWNSPWFSATPGMPETVRGAITAVATGESVRQEIHVNLPEGGWRWFDFTMRPIRDRDGAIIAIVPEAVELTQRRNAEEALRQSQKMEVMGQLTGGIAHDFNNMLAIIIGSLDMARRRLTGSEDQKLNQCLDHAMEGAERAATLTARLLAFSRQQPLEPKNIDANKVVTGMSELLRRAIGEAIQIETVLARGLWRTFADAAQLENAIVNLAVNARDAMPSGGKLTIETANADLDDCYAAANPDVVAGQYLMIGVTDTGTGMTPEVPKLAFDPFYTTKGAGKGTGLGLS